MAENIKDRYVYVQRNDEPTAIGIRSGPYDGVIISYGRVSFGKHETPEGNLPLQFEYTIVDNNGLQRESFGEEFFNLIGQILEDIIAEQLEEGDLQYVNSND